MSEKRHEATDLSFAESLLCLIFGDDASGELISKDEYTQRMLTAVKKNRSDLFSFFGGLASWIGIGATACTIILAFLWTIITTCAAICSQMSVQLLTIQVDERIQQEQVTAFYNALRHVSPESLVVFAFFAFALPVLFWTWGRKGSEKALRRKRDVIYLNPSHNFDTLDAAPQQGVESCRDQGAVWLHLNYTLFMLALSLAAYLQLYDRASAALLAYLIAFVQMFHTWTLSPRTGYKELVIQASLIMVAALAGITLGAKSIPNCPNVAIALYCLSAIPIVTASGILGTRTTSLNGLAFVAIGILTAFLLCHQTTADKTLLFCFLLLAFFCEVLWLGTFGVPFLVKWFATLSVRRNAQEASRVAQNTQIGAGSEPLKKELRFWVYEKRKMLGVYFVATLVFATIVLIVLVAAISDVALSDVAHLNIASTIFDAPELRTDTLAQNCT